MQRINSLRELLPGNQGGAEAVAKMQANLRANIHQEVHPDEARMMSQVPGDDETQHLMYTPPNPYMKHGFAKLKRAWDTGRVPESEKALVKTAMLWLADGQAWGDKEPYCIAKDQTEVRYYSGNLNGDEDIFDSSAFRGPSKFNPTIQHSDD
jgi:hypothetical protein